jgi:outer membrane protein assembly factor BamB
VNDDDDELCESCGTNLPVPNDDGYRTCPSCGRVDRVKPDPEPEPAEVPPSDWLPTGSSGTHTTTVITTTVHTTKAGGGFKLGCLVSLVVLAFVAAVSVKSCESATKAVRKSLAGPDSTYPLSGNALVLPGEGDTTEVVTYAQDNKAQQRSVRRVRFDGAGSKELWRSDAFKADAYGVTLAVDGDTVYAAANDQLRALNATTGKERWRTTLTDKVDTSCDGACFTVVSHRLVVRTQDAYLSGFGPRSSEPAWTLRLRSTSAGAWLAAGALLVVDDPEDAGGYTVVSTLDPATGRVVRRISPLCFASGNSYPIEMSSGDPVRSIPGSTDLFAVFGFGYSCAVRWDPATGKARWSTELEDLSSIDQDLTFVTATQALVKASSDSARIDLATGRIARLQLPADTQAVPRTIVQGTIVADTTTTRGSTRGGLLGWDLRTGQVLWSQRLPGGSQPVSTGATRSSDALFDGSPRSLLVAGGGKLRIVTFEGTDRTMSVRSIDPRTGDLGVAETRKFSTRYDSGTPSLTIEAVTSSYLLVSVDSLLERIPLTGSGDIVTWPDVD